MNAHEESPTKQKKHTRLKFWMVFLAFCTSVFVASIYGPNLLFSPQQVQGGQDEMAASRTVEHVEDQIRSSLNTDSQIVRAGLHCTSLRLTRKSQNEYAGLATLDDGQELWIEVTDEGTDYLYRVRPLTRRTEPSGNAEAKRNEETQPRNDTDSVTNSALPGYESTTIGSAFNAFFKDPKWELKVAGNGARYVLFTGCLKKDMFPPDAGNFPAEALMATYGIDWWWKNGDTVRIKFAISSDSSSFALWSVQMGDGVEIRSTDWEKRGVLDILFEAIYKIQ